MDTDALAAAHGCPDGCPACRRSVADANPDRSFERWRPFVESSAALRMARVAQFSGRFPELTADPLEQFLVEEAVLDRWETMLAEREAAREAAERAAAERREQEQQAKERIRAHIEAREQGR